MSPHPMRSRREFLRNAAFAVGGIGLADTTLAQQPAPSANGEKLNLAFIGPGGRGQDNLNALSSENIVALCDVDDVRANEIFARYPKAARYRDFRELLDKERSLD